MHFFTYMETIGRIRWIIVDGGSMNWNISKGLDALKFVFMILNKYNSINQEDVGLKLDKIDGNVELKNIEVSYLSHLNIIVLREF